MDVSGLQTDARLCKKRSHSVSTQFGAKRRAPSPDTREPSSESSESPVSSVQPSSDSDSNPVTSDEEWLPQTVQADPARFVNVDMNKR